MNNFLDGEDLIIERLRSTVDDPPIILSAAEAAAIADEIPRTPALIVVYDGDAIVSDTPSGTTKLNLRYTVWVVVLNNQADGKAARKEASYLISAVHRALLNWRPDRFFGSIRRAAGPAPVYASGCAFFPVPFVLPRVERSSDLEG